MRQGVRGFSLIEILVVITIIGLLIAVSGGAYMKYTSYSQWVKTKALITELETYARDYNDRRGDFPPSSLKSLGIASTGDEANEGIEVHPYVLKADPRRPMAFTIPREATRDGALTLRWQREPGHGRAGRSGRGSRQ